MLYVIIRTNENFSQASPRKIPFNFDIDAKQAIRKTICLTEKLQGFIFTKKYGEKIVVSLFKK